MSLQLCELIQNRVSCIRTILWSHEFLDEVAGNGHRGYLPSARYPDNKRLFTSTVSLWNFPSKVDNLQGK